MITRKDIAKRLGVSVSVVSRALNNSGYVEKEKKEQIITLARELGYTREPAAIRREQARTRLVLFYLRDTRNAFYIEVYEGMVEAAAEKGYGVLLYCSGDFEQLRSMAVDGIVFSNESIAVDYLKTVGKQYYLPAVSCSYGYNYLLPRSIPQVDCDVLQGTVTIINYLRERGHQKIAMISPEDITVFGIREIAWRSAMTPIFGEQIADYMFIIDGNESGNEDVDAYRNRKCDYYTRGSIGARRFVESGCDATAVICFNEEVALGFCRTLADLHVRIPEDVSVTTYDGTYMSRHFAVPITMVSLNPHLQGRCCVQTLLDLIDGKPMERVQHVPVEIVEGASVRNIRG